MESELIEEILLGSFPSEAVIEEGMTGRKNMQAVNLLKETVPTERQKVLSLRKKLINILSSGSSGKPSLHPLFAPPGYAADEILHPDRWYFKPVNSASQTGRLWQQVLSMLITCEVMLMAGSMVTRLSGAATPEEDRLYFGNLALRKWNDYLKLSRKGSSAIRLARHSLFALVLDFSERLRRTEAVQADFYAPEDLKEWFPGEYETGVPVSPTAEWAALKLKRVADRPAGQREDILTGLMTRCMSFYMAHHEKTDTASELTGCLAMLERALFLIFLNPPFLKDYPEKIADAEFTRQWIQEEFKSHTGKDDLLKTLEALERTQFRMHSMPDSEMLKEKLKGSSDVQILLHTLKTTPFSSFSDAENASGKRNIKNQPDHPEKDEQQGLVQGLKDTFLTKDQVKEIFNINSNDAFNAFADRHKLTYHEVSTHNHLYYKEEIMDILNKIKKQRGG